MHSRRHVIAAGLVAGLLAQTTGAAGQNPPLRLAVVATAGSPHQPHGQDVAAAARATVAALNARGGLLGRSIDLDVREDDCTAGSAERVAREIAALAGPARPDVVIGHLCSPAAIMASKIYAEAGLVSISPGARHARLTDERPSPLVLRLAPREDRQAGDIARLVAARFSSQRIAIVHDRSVQARALADNIEATLAQSGIKLVLREPYTHSEKSYGPTIERLRAAEAQVVIFPAQPVELGIMVPSLAATLPQATVIAGDAAAAADLHAVAALLGPRFVVMLPWLERPLAPARAVSKAPPERQPQRSPAWLATQAAIEAWSQAVTKAGSAESLAVVRSLETDAAPTVAGRIRFDTRGDVAVTSYVPWRWDGTDWRAWEP